MEQDRSRAPLPTSPSIRTTESSSPGIVFSKNIPEFLSRQRRQARVKGNDISTRAGEALDLHICMEAPLHQWVEEGSSLTEPNSGKENCTCSGFRLGGSGLVPGDPSDGGNSPAIPICQTIVKTRPLMGRFALGTKGAYQTRPSRAWLKIGWLPIHLATSQPFGKLPRRRDLDGGMRGELTNFVDLPCIYLESENFLMDPFKLRTEWMGGMMVQDVGSKKMGCGTNIHVY
ncbi:hypothetical protein KSP39_PZI013883 [Platanthera zijinensis]|uniref:Uncharacterized protein n=1 Tax=Platanthera zijinensis TaxID=2320716 RepID=A0AAP0BDW1_9ASPA